MKVSKFLLAAVAGIGIVKFLGYMTEAEPKEDIKHDIYDDEDHPLFV